MSVSREQIPESVWRAREVDSLERGRAEDDYQRHLATLKPVRKPSMWEQVEHARLEAIVTLGPVDLCVGCGFRVQLQDGLYVCAFCGYGWQGDDDE